MSLPNYLLLLGCFVCTVFGFGLPLALRLTEDALEQVTAAAMIGLVVSFVLAFGIYAAGLSWWWFALAPVAGLIGLISQGAAIRNIWSNPNARQSLIGWLIVAAWTQALTAMIRSYSGGAWGDWLEHHQRALFFHEHWRLDFNFIGDYLLTARPPLANVVTAGFEAITQNVLACGQAVLALWSSLAVFPLALFCRRFGGGAERLPVLALLLMLNPSFTQNSTFAWTKLPAAFFVLVGAHFLLSSLDRPDRRALFALAAAALAAALLTHYSAGPYCIVLAGWWILWRLHEKAFRSLAMEMLTGLLVVTPLLGLWFSWAWIHYGAAGTFLSNSTATDSDAHGLGAQLGRIAANLWDTLVPHPLRSVNYALIRQPTRIGWFRDYFFMINQVNLPAMLGTGGLVALACSFFKKGPVIAGYQTSLRPAWVISALVLTIILGVAVVGSRDEWGLAHICLQPVSLLGLACLAARIDLIGRIGGVILGLGLAWDAVVNIGLHYTLQSRDPDPAWLALHNPMQALIQYGSVALSASLKDVTGVRFLRDGLPGLAIPVAALLIVLVAAAIWLRCTTRGPQPRRT
ncbi:MAG: hypothetical protein WC661_03715 [Opitutaceae bacterium]|jgi:hypothetical protein